MTVTGYSCESLLFVIAIVLGSVLGRCLLVSDNLGMGRPDKMVLDKMVRTKWYGQNDSNFVDSNLTELNFYSVTTSHKQVISLNGSKWKRD